MKVFLSALVLAFMVTGCGYVGTLAGQVKGSGNRKSEKRQVAAFTALDVSGAFHVELVCQKDPSLEIEGDDNLLPLVTTEVKNGTLHVRSDKGFSTNKPVTLKITTQDLQALDASGASEITVNGIKNEGLDIESSGASTIIATGETKTLRINMSGAGSIKAGELRAEKVSVESSGAGNAHVYATGELSADVSGAASVTYAGDPKVTHRNVSGAGSISKK